jgi:hypothetical protein
MPLADLPGNLTQAFQQLLAPDGDDFDRTVGFLLQHLLHSERYFQGDFSVRVRRIDEILGTLAQA